MPSAWTTDDRRRSIRMNDDYQLWIGPRDSLGGRVDYSVTSHARFRALEPLTPGEQERFRRLPPGSNPRTRALVDSWLADSPSAATLIERGLDIFRQDGFFYTLTPPALGEHTADEFIFDTREGFCEHYASAFAIMMRMAGLPARVVTGYQGGELNSFGQYYIIRQSNAHAWTEVWTPDGGWQRVDPIAAVAPDRIALGINGSALGSQVTIVQRIGRFTLLRQVTLAWDAANTFWNNWVIGYGPALQRTLFRWLGFERPRWREMLWLTTAATFAILVVVTIGFGMRARRSARPDQAAEIYLQFERRLTKLGVEPMRSGETPTEFANRAAMSAPASRGDILSITGTYLAARYEPDTDGYALQTLRNAVRAFRPRRAPASP
jgi:transglutaminase-like putative cysteine protease